MAGIYGIILNKPRSKNIYRYFYNSDFPDIIQEELDYETLKFGRSVLNKFQKDRFLYQNEDFIVCFEGINYSSIKSPQDFIEAYQQKGTEFIKELKGSFSGFIFSKKEEEMLIFNDLLSTRVLYYYYDKEQGFAFASEMHVLSRVLKESGISLNMNPEGVYSVALYGQTYYDFTLIQEIKKLDYGSFIRYRLRDKKLVKDSYFRFVREEKDLPLEEIIDKMDGFMLKAVQEEWEKDRSYGYEHFALISGGMDSRVNTLLARKLGFKNLTTYTYGDPKSSDVRIAKKIAEENFKQHSSFSLSDGSFFCHDTLEKYIKATDGLTYFTANAVIYNAFKPIDFSTYGLVHSGQLGDTATGSFIKPNFDYAKNLDSIGLTGFVNQPEILEKLDFLKDIVSDYQYSDNDVFTYEQRQVNGTLMGDKVFNNFIDIASPFYDKEFLDLMLSIPTSLKINQQIYFEWLKKKHPKILDYKWDKIGSKPNKKFNIKYGRMFQKYYNGGKKYLGLPYDSMSPVNIWLKKDPKILQEFDKMFEENIHLIEDQEMQSDLRKIYENDIFEFRNKFSVLSAVLGLRLHI